MHARAHSLIHPPCSQFLTGRSMDVRRLAHGGANSHIERRPDHRHPAQRLLARRHVARVEMVPGQFLVRRVAQRRRHHLRHRRAVCRYDFIWPSWRCGVHGAAASVHGCSARRLSAAARVQVGCKLQQALSSHFAEIATCQPHQPTSLPFLPRTAAAMAARRCSRTTVPAWPT